MTNMGWLPGNESQEDKVSALLLEYAFKSCSFSLHGFAHAQKIPITDIQDLAKNNGPHELFPNSCEMAITLVKNRQDNTDAFCEMLAQDRDGKLLWKELHLYDELGNITCFFELFS